MNGSIDYMERARLVRAVLGLRAKHPAVEEYVLDAKLDMLDRMERGLAHALEMLGLSPEAAAESACSFMRQCVAAIRAEQSA